MRTKLVIEIESRDITSDKLPVLEEEVGKEESELSTTLQKYLEQDLRLTKILYRRLKDCEVI